MDSWVKQEKVHYTAEITTPALLENVIEGVVDQHLERYEQLFEKMEVSLRFTKIGYNQILCELGIFTEKHVFNSSAFGKNAYHSLVLALIEGREQIEKQLIQGGDTMLYEDKFGMLLPERTVEELSLSEIADRGIHTLWAVG